MKTMTKLITAGAVVAGTVATVAVVRVVKARRREKVEELTEDDLIVDPVTVAIEEVFVLTDEDPTEPSTFTT